MKRIGKIIFHNFWAKIICLILAVSTWFYVFDMISTDYFLQKKETAEDVMMRYKFSVKEVPVKPVFFGKAPTGHRVLFDEVKVEPEKISVYLPEDMMEDVTELRTESIGLGEYTRGTWYERGIVSDVDALRFDDQTIRVFVPVEPIEKQK